MVKGNNSGGNNMVPSFNFMEFDTGSHESGQDKNVNGKYSVEKKETQSGDYVFSDYLKPKGSDKTFAELSKKYKPKSSDDPITKRTKKLQLNKLQAEQEIVKGIEFNNSLNAQQMKCGGSIKKMRDGGLIPDDFSFNNMLKDNLNFLGDAVKTFGFANASMIGGLTGMDIPELEYKSTFFNNNEKNIKKGAELYGGLNTAMAPLAANMIAPGSGALLSATGQGIGTAINANQQPEDTIVPQVGLTGMTYMRNGGYVPEYANGGFTGGGNPKKVITAPDGTQLRMYNGVWQIKKPNSNSFQRLQTPISHYKGLFYGQSVIDSATGKVSTWDKKGNISVPGFNIDPRTGIPIQQTTGNNTSIDPISKAPVQNIASGLTIPQMNPPRGMLFDNSPKPSYGMMDASLYPGLGIGEFPDVSGDAGKMNKMAIEDATSLGGNYSIPNMDKINMAGIGSSLSNSAMAIPRGTNIPNPTGSSMSYLNNTDPYKPPTDLQQGDYSNSILSAYSNNVDQNNFITSSFMNPLSTNYSYRGNENNPLPYLGNSASDYKPPTDLQPNDSNVYEKMDKIPNLAYSQSSIPEMKAPIGMTEANKYMDVNNLYDTPGNDPGGTPVSFKSMAGDAGNFLLDNKNTILRGMPMAINAIMALQKPEKTERRVSTFRPTLPQYDITEQLRQNERNTAMANKMARDASGGSGAALYGMMSGNIDRQNAAGAALNQTKQNVESQNQMALNQYLGSQEMYNIGLLNQYDQLDLANKAAKNAYWENIAQGMADIGTENEMFDLWKLIMPNVMKDYTTEAYKSFNNAGGN